MTEQVLLLASFPETALPRLVAEFPQVRFLDGRAAGSFDRHMEQATIAFGLPPVEKLAQAARLRWIQLASAGVPQDLCPIADERGIKVTNLAGLYAASIAEHALCLMVMLARNLHAVVRKQQQALWDRSVAQTMRDLQGHTVAIVGLGSIGQGVARLARAYGTRVIGCRRTDRPVPLVDRVYRSVELREMLGEADYVVVAAPLTRQTAGMLGPAEFAAIKRGVIYINVSRGAVAQESALLDALRSGHVAAAGLDVFAVEPLPSEHPFWTMPQVILSPHYSGETVNQSSLPVERFARNLHAWLSGGEMEGVVNLDWGY
ncbi:MAG TPA: D-2-hydroxyacid dehydrogenase [Gemmataceae bacterium]|jgi:D-2-hydroxyacid dehydrogenase (NADP+)|nr:D-2-hydroxyacid dehydrogenase [Gemmataceae bacterium]